MTKDYIKGNFIFCIKSERIIHLDDRYLIGFTENKLISESKKFPSKGCTSKI